MKSLHLVVLAASVLGAQCAAAQEFIIRGATVHTASAKGTLKNTDVLVRGGVIVAIGSETAAPNATGIDGKGKELRPGGDLPGALQPGFLGGPITRVEGVTWTVLAPSSEASIIGGHGSAVTL